MKKMIGRLALVLVVASMVFATGCVIVRPCDRCDRKYKISGDIPRVGELVRVREVAGHETPGPYRYDITWSYYSEEVGKHTCFTLWEKVPGLDDPGVYAVVRGVQGGVYFAKTK